jgi:type II secretory pathway pseudopilin PulG
MATTRGFSRVDLIAAITVLVIVAALLAIGRFRMTSESRKQKDGDQLRDLHKAIAGWAQSNGDDYPLPSRVDRANYVLNIEAKAKDTTSNIYSMLIFNGSIEPELLVSPVEVNRNIGVCRNYEFDHPSGAAQPIQATWDPKLSAVLDGTRPGHISYAHMQVFEGRRAKWTNSFNAAEALLANRGPEITAATLNPDSSVTPTLANLTNNTLRFYGRGQTWSGWKVFNDNHKEFRSDFLKNGRAFKPEGITYTTGAGVRMPDIWCYDELDDLKAANDYIGIFLKAGSRRGDWLAAWD